MNLHPITMYNQGETEMSGIDLVEILVGWQATIKQVNKTKSLFIGGFFYRWEKWILRVV